MPVTIEHDVTDHQNGGLVKTGHGQLHGGSSEEEKKRRDNNTVDNPGLTSAARLLQLAHPE
jgi:hypothetical protein